MTSYLLRVHLPQPLDTLVKNIASEYSLGKLRTYSIFELGYEDVNIKLETHRGIYVLKIFSKIRPLSFPKQYTFAMEALYKQGVPVPKLFLAKNKTLQSINSNNITTQYCVMEYFNGKSFLEIEPKEEDFLAVSGFLALFHSTNISVVSDYDSWGVTNIVAEYQKNKRYIRQEDFSAISSAVEEFSSINFSQCKKTLIHGDMQKAHVLKNKNGCYCIIDFGCMANDYSVFDLGIFFGQLGIDIDHSHLSKIIVKSLSEYKKRYRLSEYEISLIPAIMRVQNAAYVIKTSYLKAAGDNSEQTEYWYTYCKRGLTQLQKFTLST